MSFIFQMQITGLSLWTVRSTFCMHASLYISGHPPDMDVYWCFIQVPTHALLVERSLHREGQSMDVDVPSLSPGWRVNAAA